MYTQAQVYTNHRPKKILIDPIQLTWINPRTPNPHFNSSLRTPPSPSPPCNSHPPAGGLSAELSGWCIWHRALPRLRLKGRYSIAQTPGLSRVCPASFWTPSSQSPSYCRTQKENQWIQTLKFQHANEEAGVCTCTHGRSSLSLSLAAGMKNEYNMDTPWESMVISNLCSF